MLQSKFYTITVVHPHSGQVSRSIISKLLMKSCGEKSGKDAAIYLTNFSGIVAVHLQDTNGKISIESLH